MSHPHDHHHQHDHSLAAPAAKDPVCGMTVKPDTAHRTLHEGRDVLFCSAGCKAKFEADPARYTAHDHTTQQAGAPSSPPAGSKRRSSETDRAHVRSAAWRLSP
jgi:Cu+-exporting ATPase